MHAQSLLTVPTLSLSLTLSLAVTALKCIEHLHWVIILHFRCANELIGTVYLLCAVYYRCITITNPNPNPREFGAKYSLRPFRFRVRVGVRVRVRSVISVSFRVRVRVSAVIW